MDKSDDSAYAKHFDRSGMATEYERRYVAGTYDDMLWEIERQQLDAVLPSGDTLSSASYLDFATGTGRIIGHLAPRVRSAVGVDTSVDMLTIARERYPTCSFVQGDILDPATLEGDRFDVITAFRFFLNADPDLRGQVMRSLASRLRNPDSVLIFNDHGHVPSHKSVRRLAHQRRQQGAGGPLVAGNYMTTREARDLARQAGLTLQHVGGCGFLSSTVARLLPASLIASAEGTLSSVGLVRGLGGNQMYVARRSD
jgi:SAM-dependent methyltransferase